MSPVICVQSDSWLFLHIHNLVPLPELLPTDIKNPYWLSKRSVSIYWSLKVLNIAFQLFWNGLREGDIKGYTLSIRGVSIDKFSEYLGDGNIQ